MCGFACDTISPTAKLVAHIRTFASLLYANEIAQACNAEYASKQLVGEDMSDFLWHAPMVELRYLSVDAALREYFKDRPVWNPRNILELASGLSPRGLDWTKGLIRSKGGQYTYLETDLPGILNEKRSICMSILREPRNNLGWQPLNVTNRDQFAAAVEWFDNAEPIAVINEGLLPYLTRDELEQAARNVHWLLTQRGGVWITPDIAVRDHLDTLVSIEPKMGRMLTAISDATGRDLRANAFDSYNEAIRFFEAAGLKITHNRQHKLVTTALQSLQCIASYNQENVQSILERGGIWTMTAQ